MENLIPAAVVLLVLGAVIRYLWRAKKRGVHCIGCSASGSCGGGCSGCHGCGQSAPQENTHTGCCGG